MAKSGEGKSCKNCEDEFQDKTELNCRSCRSETNIGTVYHNWRADLNTRQPKTKESGEIPQITARVYDKYYDDILGNWIYKVKINEADIGEWHIDFAKQIINKLNTDVEKVIFDVIDTYPLNGLSIPETNILSKLRRAIVERLSSEVQK